MSLWNRGDNLATVKDKFNQAFIDIDKKIDKAYERLKERIANAPSTPTEVGLGNVDNTADIDKPVSTPQKAYIESRIKALQAFVTTKVENDLQLVSFELDDDGNFIPKVPPTTINNALQTFYTDDEGNLTLSPNQVRFYYSADLVFMDEPLQVNIPIPTDISDRFYRVYIYHTSGDEPQILLDEETTITTFYNFKVTGNTEYTLSFVINAAEGEKGVYRIVIQSYFAENEETIKTPTELEGI